MTSKFRQSILTLSILSAFGPSVVHAADESGQWIQDGFGRSTRDGLGSACVSSGGDDHAFASADCDASAAARRAPVVVPRAAYEPPPSRYDRGMANTVEPGSGLGADAGGAYVRDGTGRLVKDGVDPYCVMDSRWSPAMATSECDPDLYAAWRDKAAPEPVELAQRIQMPPPEIDPASLAEAPAAAPAPDTGAVAIAPMPANTAAATDDVYPDDAGPAPDWVREGDNFDEDEGLAVAGVAGADALAGAAVVDENYAPGSVEITDRSPGVPPPPEPRKPEQAPVIDNRMPEFPVTKYSIEGSGTAAKQTRPEAAVTAAATGGGSTLRRAIEVEKAALFDTNSARLKANVIPDLDELAQALKASGGYGKITVTGHTDRMGSDRLNDRLSVRRARAVRDYLVAKGIDPAKIVAVGKGRREPVTTADACDGVKGKKALRACLAPDRRVEIEATAVLTETVPATN